MLSFFEKIILCIVTIVFFDNYSCSAITKVSHDK